MSRESIESALAAEVERLRAEFPWWPGFEIAPVAYRRWGTFARRNKAKRPTRDDRIHDLVKGLQAAFEPDIPYTHYNDWRALAERLATVLETAADHSRDAP